MRYSFDTSALVVPFRNWPAPAVMPSLWNKLDSLIQSKDIVASKEVYIEISEKDDDLLRWVVEREYMFLEIDEEQQETVRRIMRRFPKWVDADSEKNNADPWVIALAIRYGLAVVNNEMHGGEKNPKIPYVCKVFGVKHLSLKDEFLEEINWQA